MLKDKLPTTINCGFCSKTAVLVDKTCTVGKNGTVFDMLSYDCPSCGESFTTTESDSISLYRYTSAQRLHNRKELRKERIIKCMGNQV